MPKISMWSTEKGNNYRWLDRQISAMYDAGGTGIGVHKYLGPVDQGPTGDATRPSYAEQSEWNIQDVLFLENRDRKYDPDVYVLRGAYQRSDNDFDLTQFGLFLQSGTIIMTFHYNNMVEMLGRRIMNGDVLELFHLKDDDVPGVDAALKRFYVAGDCSWASEGFSPTWYPHIWRVKLNPLVDSQEYKNVLKGITATNSSGPQGTSVDANGNPGGTPLSDIMSTYSKYLNINTAVIQQAETEVPKSGYDVSKIYSPSVDKSGNVVSNSLTADDAVDTSDSTATADAATYSPPPTQNPKGWLSGDGEAPNGMAVQAGVTFPSAPAQGDYFLRLDYLPNRLFRFDGRRWVKMEDNVRTNLTPGSGNDTLRNSFANNNDTITLRHSSVDAAGNVAVTEHTVPSRQGLSKALRPTSDY